MGVGAGMSTRPDKTALCDQGIRAKAGFPQLVIGLIRGTDRLRAHSNVQQSYDINRQTWRDEPA